MNTVTVKPPTHIQIRRNAAERCMRLVLLLMDLDEEEYCWLKYENGLVFLHHYQKGDAFIIDSLSRNVMFWNWWKNQWTLRDEAMLMDYDNLSRLSLSVRRKTYLNTHNPAAIASELHPNAVILADSYDDMMQKLMRNSKTKQHEPLQ